MSARDRLRSSALSGVRSGVKTWWWIARITIFATLLVVLLQWSGGIGFVSEVLSPVFELFGLSTEAVLVFVTTALANIYAGIGVMATLAIDYREAVLLSVMGLICHNLIVETIIQRRSGASGTLMVVLRVASALLAAVALNYILPEGLTGTLIIERATSIEGLPFWDAMLSWARNMATMIPTMFVIIVGLNTIQQILREFHILHYISKPFNPIMLGFGLRQDSALIWLILNTLGLAYGGAIMISGRDSGELALRESRLLNTHIALSHSLLEDTLLYLALGVPLFWLVVPRVLLAIMAVWVQRAYYKFRGK